MYTLMIIVVVIACFIVMGLVGKWVMRLYGAERMGYNAAYTILILTTLIYLAAIYVGAALIAFHIVAWLGWVVAAFGTLLFLASFGGDRTVMSDARHSLKLIRHREDDL